MTNSIPKKVLQALGQIAVETGKETLKEVGKVTESIVTGKELLGDIRPMTDGEMAAKRAEDERKKQAEMEKLRQSMGGGRNVEAEVREISREKQQSEEDKERQFLEQIKRQREAEAEEHQKLSVEMGVSANPAKRKKKRGSALMQGKKKTNQPDPSQLSQTGEIAGKME